MTSLILIIHSIMPFLVIIVLIAAIFFSWFFKHKSEQEERRILIEKGVPVEKLPERENFTFDFPWLKTGCIIVFSGFGAIIAKILFDARIIEGAPPVFMVMIFFGGIGMIVVHYIDKPNDEKSNHDG